MMELNPADHTLYARAVQLVRQGRLMEARDSYLALLAAAPDMAEARNDLGYVLLGLGDPVAAEPHLRAAIGLNPEFAGALFNLGLCRSQQRDPAGAMGWYRRVLEIQSGHFEALNNLANLLRTQGQMEEAVEAYRQATLARPDAAYVLANMAHTLENLHCLDEALETARRALELEPLNPVANLVVAQISRRRGDLDTARRQLEPLAGAGLAPNHAAAVNFELGTIYDRLQDYPQAFEAWSRANAVWRDALGPERSRDTTYLDYIRHVGEQLPHLRVADWPLRVNSELTQQPVFLVGFPRSGTTLMEQLLDAHPDFSSSREQPVLSWLVNLLQERNPGREYPALLDSLTEDEIVQLRADYRQRIATELPDASHTRCFVDKLPLNIVDLLVVRRVFPEAKVLVMLRDPRDACLSAFAQTFQPNRAMVQFLSLEGSARLYSAVMDLWLQLRTMPGLQYLEVHYEDLTVELVPVMQRVLEFLGSAWDPVVEQFHEKAREQYARTPSYQDITAPVYRRAVGRWRHYQAMLAPVLPQLERFVDRFGYRDA